MEIENVKKGTPESQAESSHPKSGNSEYIDSEESITTAVGAANKASTAVKNTAQKYLNTAGIKVDLDDVEGRISDRPFLYLAVAAGAGFIIGGGMATRMGVALLGIFGRKAATETATNFGREILQKNPSGTRPRISNSHYRVR